MNSTTRDRRPTTVADYHRLAALGRDRGLRLFEPAPNRWYCSSASDPFALHVVTGWSCDCAGFAHLGRCSHYALLLSALGWLPDPEPPALAPCGYCSGRGWETVVGGSGAAYRFACRLCEGAGEVEVEESDPAPAVAETRHCRTCGHRTSGASYCSEACAELGPLHGASGPIQLVTIAA